MVDGPAATILVVDDQPENLAVMGELLASRYRVRVANSGERALAAAASEPRPDLILLDVLMPDMDGYEVLRRLRERPETVAVPVIFVTAMDGEDNEQLGFALGAADYIMKPIKPAILEARVQAHISLQQVTGALRRQNADLESEVRRRMRDNLIVQDVAMRALASLAETRDNETGNHIRRTQAYVETLAHRLSREADFSALRQPDLIDVIAKAAPLHDIGKVGIPDYILNKPGKLEAAEWEIMKTHAAIGAEAIANAMAGEDDHGPLAFFHVAMDIAQSHHEKWDGTGYPAGLAGADIPLAGRLMAVADVFDALITRRVYKPPFPHEQAAEMIRAGSGTQFDPALVTAFDACFDDFCAIAQRYRDAD